MSASFMTCDVSRVTPIDMNNSKIGFIGLGNVGGKLAGSLARNGIDLTVRDLNSDLEQPFVANGAARAASPVDMVRKVDVVITCLPSPMSWKRRTASWQASRPARSGWK
jgi:3-hydroxyisobutyrate dehydrogenase-like beta-hydroxyacid dehydrogenase